MPYARDLMTADCACASLQDSIVDAARRMRDSGVGALPIYGEDRKLAGMITDRDIVVGCVADGMDPVLASVAVFATGAPVTIDGGASAEEAMATMAQHGVRRLPVIEHHHLVGMLSQADLARALSDDVVGELVGAISASPPNN